MKPISKIFAGAAIAAAVTATLSSCEMEYYKEELYRKEIYLVSGENNIFGQEFEFGGDVGYLSVYCSGTIPIDRDVTVAITKDYEAISEYNKRNYDVDYGSYALEVPAENYTMENSTVVLKNGSETPYALCPIKVNIDELYTDQDYFIPLRIESVSDYMASATKNYVLFRVFMKNDYSTTRQKTYYTMNGSSQAGTLASTASGMVFTPTDNIQTISSSKLTVPISQRSMRIMPAARVAGSSLNTRNWGMTLTVDPIQTVDIPVLDGDGLPTGRFNTMRRVFLKPYNTSQDAVRVEEFVTNPSYYDPLRKCFVLNYAYKLASETLWYRISETMYDTRY